MDLEFTNGQTGSGISPDGFPFPIPGNANGMGAGKSPEDVLKGGQQCPALSQISPCTFDPTSSNPPRTCVTISCCVPKLPFPHNPEQSYRIPCNPNGI